LRAVLQVQVPRGAYTWRGLFSEFYGISIKLNLTKTKLACGLGYPSDDHDRQFFMTPRLKELTGMLIYHKFPQMS